MCNLRVDYLNYYFIPSPGHLCAQTIKVCVGYPERAFKLICERCRGLDFFSTCFEIGDVSLFQLSRIYSRYSPVDKSLWCTWSPFPPATSKTRRLQWNDNSRSHPGLSTSDTQSTRQRKLGGCRYREKGVWKKLKDQVRIGQVDWVPHWFYSECIFKMLISL